jgi:glutathione peroxidase-family protein
LAFPNNQFANMEPGTNEEIFEFVADISKLEISLIYGLWL